MWAGFHHCTRKQSSVNRQLIYEKRGIWPQETRLMMMKEMMTNKTTTTRVTLNLTMDHCITPHQVKIQKRYAWVDLTFCRLEVAKNFLPSQCLQKNKLCKGAQEAFFKKNVKEWYSSGATLAYFCVKSSLCCCYSFAQLFKMFSSKKSRAVQCLTGKWCIFFPWILEDTQCTNEAFF